jgi:hypothetical protein
MQCHQAKYMGWLGRVVDAGDWAFAGGGWVGSLSRALQFSIFMGTWSVILVATPKFCFGIQPPTIECFQYVWFSAQKLFFGA